jgi:probable F420-dependent oxidoreductase
MMDHLTFDLPPIAAMMAAADATETLRIGSHVFCNDYRHPAVLAKEVAALDLLSDGRFEFGIGAGWQQSEYEQAGITYEAPGTRISRLEEALAIFKGVFMQETFSFSGKYYQIAELQGLPRPVQKPYPPIYLGGGGKRMLTLAAREADIVSFVPIAHAQASWQDMSDGTAEATMRKVEWVRDAAGERLPQLELHTSVFALIVTGNRQQVAGYMASNFGLAPQQVLDLTHTLLGSVDEICETLQTRRERYGISYVTILDKDMETFAPVVERLRGQ